MVRFCLQALLTTWSRSASWTQYSCFLLSLSPALVWFSHHSHRQVLCELKSHCIFQSCLKCLIPPHIFLEPLYWEDFLLIIWNNRFFKFTSLSLLNLLFLLLKFVSALWFPCVLCSHLRIYRTLQRDDFLIKWIDFFLELVNLFFFSLFLIPEFLELRESFINSLCCVSSLNIRICRESNWDNESCNDEFPWWIHDFLEEWFLLCVLWNSIVHMWKN